jgi:hypothetical protein
MYLYKQLIIAGKSATDLDLLGEYASAEEAKNAARNIAIKDQCADIAWGSPYDDSGNPQEPYELTVNDEYRLIVRSW